MNAFRFKQMGSLARHSAVRKMAQPNQSSAPIAAPAAPAPAAAPALASVARRVRSSTQGKSQKRSRSFNVKGTNIRSTSAPAPAPAKAQPKAKPVGKGRVFKIVRIAPKVEAVQAPATTVAPARASVAKAPKIGRKFVLRKL